MFVVKPRIAREIARQFAFNEREEGEQQDYAINQVSMEIPFFKAALAEDGRKTLTKVKPGDIVVIEPAVSFEVKNRIIMVEAHKALFDHGVPSFKRIYRHGDQAPTAVVWSCMDALDLEKLPYLLEVYIIDTHVR